ncbi:MAG: hypothetical protein JWP11_2928 [Frankiales bacterium]|nr:hypothetical protein [Frankiales bacterium]
MSATHVEPTLDDALAERDQALALVEDAGDAWDRAVIDQGIAALNARGVPWSANDLRPLLPEVRAALVGARFLAAAKRGEMVRSGWVTSTDPGTHARPIALWGPAVTR